MYSLIIPVYRNEDTIPALLEAVTWISQHIPVELEAVFVVDGSPDGSDAVLATLLPSQPFRSRLLLLSRNFGSFAAIRAGLTAATGTYFAVMAADLQEPPELAVQFFSMLATGHTDIVVGVRAARTDPWPTRVAAQMFWGIYTRFVLRSIPKGGVDVFACDTAVRQWLLNCSEANSSLIGLLYWIGFRRQEVTYTRRARPSGRSAWTFSRRVRYLLDSTFSFTDLPVRLLLAFGAAAVTLAVVFGGVVVVGKLTGHVVLPGYAATILTILFFGGINASGLGVVGSYAWRAFENSKERPLSITMRQHEYTGGAAGSGTSI